MPWRDLMTKRSVFAHLFTGTALGSSAPPSRIDPTLAMGGGTPRMEEENEETTNDDEAGKRGKKGKKARKARRADEENKDTDTDADEDGDDDSDAEDEEDEEKAAARARERGRIAAIMSSKAAAANPVLALDLALHTGMTRNQVIGTLKRTGPQAQPSPSGEHGTALSALDNRMGRERTAPALGCGDRCAGRPFDARQSGHPDHGACTQCHAAQRCRALHVRGAQ